MFRSIAGNSNTAFFQSFQPCFQTNASGPTRPSANHSRMTRASAGPNWPPETGRTYQTAPGCSSRGSLATSTVSGRSDNRWGVSVVPTLVASCSSADGEPVPMVFDVRSGSSLIGFSGTEDCNVEWDPGDWTSVTC